MSGPGAARPPSPLASNDKPTWVCNGRCSGAACPCVRVYHALVGFAGKVVKDQHRCNTLSEVGARALVPVLGAAPYRLRFWWSALNKGP